MGHLHSIIDGERKLQLKDYHRKSYLTIFIKKNKEKEKEMKQENAINQKYTHHLHLSSILIANEIMYSRLSVNATARSYEATSVDGYHRVRNIEMLIFCHHCRKNRNDISQLTHTQILPAPKLVHSQQVLCL